MVAINDRSRSVFSDAEKTILNNFTDEKTRQIDEMAKTLRAILEAAKGRDLATVNRRY
jgi:hypothetical protein